MLAPKGYSYQELEQKPLTGLTGQGDWERVLRVKVRKTKVTDGIIEGGEFLYTFAELPIKGYAGEVTNGLP
jgi:hypothetical protein